MGPLPRPKKPIAVPSKINDLAVLPVTFAATSAFPHAATHYLYIRPDAPKDADEISLENQRSLFIANVPVTSSEVEFRRLFKNLNSQALVDSVVFASAERHTTKLAVTGDVIIQGTKIGVPISTIRGASQSRKRKRAQVDEDELVRQKLEEMDVPSTWGRGVWESGSSVVIRFVDPEARAVAWKAVVRASREGKGVRWPASDEEGALGLARYKQHHALTYPQGSVLQSKVNAFLTHYTTLESLRNQQLAKLRNVPDDDGFITVTRGGRTGAGRIEDAQAAQARLKEREGKRIGKDFYRFQTREEAKKREGALKRKFEEERRKVGEMRGKRKVMPE